MELPVVGGTVAGMGELGELDRAVLRFERQWWKGAGRKEQAIRDEFGWSAVQ